MELKLEIKGQEDKTPVVGPAMITPPIDDDSISREDCIAAIRMIQDAIKAEAV